jgi:predicted secreted Zn-dependent protease
MLKPIVVLGALALSLSTVGGVGAASVVKTYSYFSIGGATLDEIESELARHGPEVKSSGQRHPGATQMQFSTKIGYAQSRGRCRIAQANVSVRAKVILPKWRRSRKADREVRLIWDTLASDIKRHEESHVGIAKNYARDMEKALLAVSTQASCAAAAEKARAISAKLLARHDRAQNEFDRVEGINFESRLLRLLHYRLEQSMAARP